MTKTSYRWLAALLSLTRCAPHFMVLAMAFHCGFLSEHNWLFYLFALVDAAFALFAVKKLREGYMITGSLTALGAAFDFAFCAFVFVAHLAEGGDYIKNIAFNANTVVNLLPYISLFVFPTAPVIYGAKRMKTNQIVTNASEAQGVNGLNGA